MDRRRFLELGAAAGASVFVPAGSAADAPAFRVVADRAALLAELALFERVFFHDSDRRRFRCCEAAALGQESPVRRKWPTVPGPPPVPRNDEVMLAPERNRCILFASGRETEFRSVVDAECSGAEAVSVPLLPLFSWLAAAGDDEGPVTLRRRGPNRVEAQCGERRLRLPARASEALAAASGSPASPPAGARLVPGLDGSWFPDHLRADAYTRPSTAITVPQVMARLESEIARRDRARRVISFPGHLGAPNGTPTRRKRSVRLVLRFETMLQWMVLARAVGGPDRVLDDGARVFFECGDRRLVSRRFPDGFRFRRPCDCAVSVRTGDTRITTL